MPTCHPKQLIVRNRKCLMRKIISWICQSRLFRKPKIVNCSKARKRLSPAPAPELAGPSRSRSGMPAPAVCINYVAGEDKAQAMVDELRGHGHTAFALSRRRFEAKTDVAKCSKPFATSSGRWTS